jgi:hypothetical protein
MKVLFSEAAPDYEHYIFPYAIWAFPDNDTPAALFNAGFLPSTRELDRFYLARHLRVRLNDFAPSSENRRVLRKCAHLEMRVVPRADFQLTAERLEFCRRYADARFGHGVMSEERLETLFTAPVATDIMIFHEGGREVGYVVLYVEPPRMAFYYYSFYDLTLFERNLGLYIMTSAVKYFAEHAVELLYLGTCYSERALYKTQFRGCEFFNGVKWSTDIRELKFLVSRQGQKLAKHLLEDRAYLDSFCQTNPSDLAAAHGLRVSSP